MGVLDEAIQIIWQYFPFYKITLQNLLLAVKLTVDGHTECDL